MIQQPGTRREIHWPDWLVIVIVALALLNGLPFLAPVFMKLGWETLGRSIYLAYGMLCHQMAQRSFFLFGPQGFQMYNIADLPVQATGRTAEWTLRQFLGNDALGWKVAWSDRMVAMYASPLLVAILYAGARRLRIVVRPLPLWAFLLFVLPMALDGVTHMISDLSSGIGLGFRDSNIWLAALTTYALPTWFYAGDALGSFNSWMRLFSGLSLGIGLGWAIYPLMDRSMSLLEPSQPASADGSPAVETL